MNEARDNGVAVASAEAEPYANLFTARVARMYRLCLVCVCVCVSVRPGLGVCPGLSAPTYPYPPPLLLGGGGLCDPASS